MSAALQFTGRGLVICARDRLDAFRVEADTLFVDVCDLPALRATQPSLRAAALAPVDVVAPHGVPSDLPSASIDFVIDWAFDKDTSVAPSRFAALARVMKAGAVLTLPALDTGFASTPAEYSDRKWSFALFAIAAATLAERHTALFMLDRLDRIGRYDAAFLKRRHDHRLLSPSIIMTVDHCYVLDGEALLLISSIEMLYKLQVAGMPQTNLTSEELALFRPDRPLTNDDIGAYVRELLVTHDPAA